MTTISVLVVSYNAEEHLKHCLNSLLDLGELDDEDEIIVVDNASSDGSLDVVREFIARSAAEGGPEIRLLELSENVGFGAANNRGAEIARGDLFLLLNSDAWLAPDTLRRLVDPFRKDARVGLVVPDLRYPDGRRQFTWNPETGVVGEALQMQRNRFEGAAWNHRLLPPLLRLATGPGWYTAACVMIHRVAFEEIGGFDEDLFLYFEDVDLCRRLRLAGKQSRTAWTAKAFHVKGGSGGNFTTDLAYRRSQIAYYRKHRPRWEQRFLERRLRRKFEETENADERRALLDLLDSSA